MRAGIHNTLRMSFSQNMSKIFAFFLEKNIPRFTYILSIYFKAYSFRRGEGICREGNRCLSIAFLVYLWIMQKYDQFLVSFFHFRGMHHWQPVFRVFSQSVMSLSACFALAEAIRIRSFANSLLKTPQPASWEPLVIVSMVRRVFSEFTVTSHQFFLVCACIRYTLNMQLFEQRLLRSS